MSDVANAILFNRAVGGQFLKYASLVSARGYVHNTLGNMVIRVPHPQFPHGCCQTVPNRSRFATKHRNLRGEKLAPLVQSGVSV